MKVRLTDDLVDAIRARPRLKAETFSKEAWPSIENRMHALDDLLAGSTVLAVSTRRGMDRKTVSRLLEKAVERAPDGNLNAYQACIPLKRFAPPEPALEDGPVDVPIHAHAFAFETLLRARPDIRKKLEEFKGPLPTRTARSPSFNRLYDGVAATLRQAGFASHYPLNTGDGGRRAMQKFVADQRAYREAEIGADKPEEPSITRVEHLFSLQPFDRFEFDEHSMDIDAWFAMPLADGTYQLRHLDRLWLLGMWDVRSGSNVANSVIFGRKYHSDDVCELIAKSLSPWSPRDLVVPGMHYSPRAWMPGMLELEGLVPRGIMLAMDNDASHVSGMTRENVTDFRLGIIHYARAGNAEARGTVESRFKRYENELGRYIAGGFVPETDTNDKIIVSTLKGERYPVMPQAIEDLLDIYLSASNVSERSQRDPRTPRSITEQYLASGPVLWRCPNTLEHIRRLTVARRLVRISGSKAKKVPPLVYVDHARFRSPQLSGQWSMIGKTFRATYENPFDARQLTLWDEHGERLFTLQALPPYAAVPHTLRDRQRAAAWDAANRARSNYKSDLARLIADNVEAYHHAVREGAAKFPWAAGLIANGDVAPEVSTQVRVPAAAAPLAGFRPLAGQFRLR